MAIPDFRIQTPAVNPTAFADVLQRKQNAEDANMRADEERKNNRLKRILEAVQGGQMIASNMLNIAEKRQDLADKRVSSEGQKKFQDIITSPEPQAPSPLASSTALPEQSQFGVQPSPEQVQNYQDLKTKRTNDLKAALIQSDRKGVADIFAKQMFGNPNADKGFAPQQASIELSNGKIIPAAFVNGKYLYPNTNQEIPTEEIAGKGYGLVPMQNADGSVSSWRNTS